MSTKNVTSSRCKLLLALFKAILIDCRKTLRLTSVDYISLPITNEGFNLGLIWADSVQNLLFLNPAFLINLNVPASVSLGVAKMRSRRYTKQVVAHFFTAADVSLD